MTPTPDLSRRTFLTTLLAAPAALWALTRGAKAVEPTYVDQSPRLALIYQSLYVKLTEEARILPMPYPEPNNCREVTVTGTTAKGEVDTFWWVEHRQQDGRWQRRPYELVWRAPGGVRTDGPTPLIALRGDLHLDRLTYTPGDSRASWALDVVAIARWTEWDGMPQ